MEEEYKGYRIRVLDDEDDWYYMVYTKCICGCGNEHENEENSGFGYASRQSALDDAREYVDDLIDSVNK